jgi:hypothetical protein
MRSSIRFAVLSGFCALSAAVGLTAQAPPAGAPQAAAPAAPAQGGGRGPQNIKVLPKTWTSQQIGQVMQTFNESLGVGCPHCHAPDPTAPPPAPGATPRLSYPLDDKPEKEVARKMIAMTMKLNPDLATLGDTTKAEKVSCFTCHAGQKTPAFTPAAGWARGGFTLSEAGPQGRGGARPGGPGAPAGPGAAPAGAPAGAPPAAPARGN